MTWFGALLRVHLFCALGSTAVYWIAAFARKGSPIHRSAGRWFSRLIYAAAVTGAIMAVAGLLIPERVHPPNPDVQAAASAAAAAAARQLMWFVLFVLVIIVAPVQHGLATIAAGPSPRTISSARHTALNVAAMAGSLAIAIASIVWRQWMFLIVAPIGLVAGIRNMQYAALATATPGEWQREHLTSMITGGITLHTAFFVFGSSRSLGLTLPGVLELLPWTLAALVGVPVMLWWRARVAKNPILVGRR